MGKGGQIKIAMNVINGGGIDMETIRKIFEAIGKVTTILMAIVIGIYIARLLPLWLGGIIAVCAFVVLVIRQIEE